MQVELAQPFRRADRLHCCDFDLEDVAYVLLSTDKVDMVVAPVKISNPPDMRAGWISGEGVVHEVQRAYLLEAPSPDTGCMLVSPIGRGVDGGFFTLDRPLPWGSNPLASSVGCIISPRPS